MKARTASALFCVLALAAIAAPAAAAGSHPAPLTRTGRSPLAAMRKFWGPLLDDGLGFPLFRGAGAGCGTRCSAEQAVAPPEVASDGDGGGYVVILDTAGFRDDELRVEVVDGARLVVEGKHECRDSEPGGPPCIQRELSRAFDLSDARVQVDAISAQRTEDGVLEIRIPAAAQNLIAVPIIRLRPKDAPVQPENAENAGSTEPAAGGGDEAVADGDGDGEPELKRRELARLQHRLTDAKAAVNSAPKGPARRAAKDAVDNAKAALRAHKEGLAGRRRAAEDE